MVHKGQLMQVLHLFACRLAWLRHGDKRARHELLRASESADLELRLIAADLLAEQEPPDSESIPAFKSP